MAAIVACGDDDGAGQTATPTGSPATATPTGSPATATPGIEVRTLTADWASDNAENLARLVDSSTHVFIGEVAALNEVRFEQISPGRGQAIEVPVSVFDVRVEARFKGEFDDAPSIVVEQIGGLIEEDGVEVLIVLDGDEPLEVGAEYLFFSVEKENGAVNTPPFGRFVMESDGTVHPLEDWRELALSRELEGFSAEKLRQEIGLAVEGISPRGGNQ